MPGGVELAGRSPSRNRIGISLSGGGIRAATFCLGAYQRLREAGLEERAHYLSAVSGGSYIAAGLAVASALRPEGDPSEGAPWDRGSPEEQHLRRNLSYLAPGSTGRLWMLANFAYGVVLNALPLVVAAVLSGDVIGVLLRRLYPNMKDPANQDLDALPWVVLAASVTVAAALAVVAVRRFQDRSWRPAGTVRRARAERIVVLLTAATAVIVALGLILPGVVILIFSVTHGRVLASLHLGTGTLIVRRILVAAAVVTVAIGIGGAALWLLRLRRAPRFRAVLAVVAGATMTVVPFVLAAESEAVRGWHWPADDITCSACLAVLIWFAFFVHNRRYSLHMFYRERLQEAFLCRRVVEGDEVRVEAVPFGESITLSEVAQVNADRSAGAGPSFPQLIMCASVAARGAEVPSKTWAASFPFEGHRSGPGRHGLRVDTAELEQRDDLGRGDLTLSAMMAISGAAVSPQMGRFTIPAFRFLMAMLNIRLGVWVANPARREQEPAGEERGPVAGLVRRWRRPGAWYVIREGLGRVHTHGRYIYVADGGHWENLGLVELLRRGCTHVVVIDATADSGLGDIGRAAALARAELGVEIELDPRETAPGADGLARTPVAVGRFTYPGGEVGYIFYARLVLWPGAPPDLHLFADHNRAFPNHPTSDQFFSGEVFEAYRALGWAVAGELARQMALQPQRADEPRRTWEEIVRSAHTAGASDVSPAAAVNGESPRD